MTLGYIREIIPARMYELGYGENYLMRMRTVYVPPLGKTEFNAWNSWLYFPLEYLDRTFSLKVESDVGYLDMLGGNYRAQEFEHTGKIVFTNPSSRAMQCSFVEVTPRCTKSNVPKNED